MKISAQSKTIRRCDAEKYAPMNKNFILKISAGMKRLKMAHIIKGVKLNV